MCGITRNRIVINNDSIHLTINLISGRLFHFIKMIRNERSGELVMFNCNNFLEMTIRIEESFNTYILAFKQATLGLYNAIRLENSIRPVYRVVNVSKLILRTPISMVLYLITLS